MKKLGIILTCPEVFTKDFLAHLGSIAELVLAQCSVGEEKSISMIKRADRLIMGGNETITRKVLDSVPPNLKFIFAGIEAMTSFPGVWDEVKDRVFATGGGQAAVAEITWQQLTFFNSFRLQAAMARNGQIPPDRETILGSQTLLVIGAGTIGKMVMERAQGTFHEVVYSGGRGEKPELLKKGFRYIRDLSKAFALANVASIHLELNQDTAGSISCEHLAEIQRDGLVINNARAGIIFPEDLIICLSRRPDVQVIFDHFYVNGEEFKESMQDENLNFIRRIMGNQNFFYSGHSAFRSEQTKREYSAGLMRILKELE